MTKRAPRKGEGRPSIFTKRLGLEICARIALGESLINICKDKDYPDHATVYRWLFDEDISTNLDKKEFCDNYTRARAAQAEKMFEDIIEIADASDAVVKSGAEKKSSAYSQNQRLRVDTRKWYLSKVLPKKFGDKLDLTSDNKPIPLLHVLHKKDELLHNDSNAKDKSTPKKD